MSNPQTAGMLNGRHIALMFCAFFGVIFAVNFGMAFLAYRSWTGLVVENSYVASQSFNADVADLRKSEALGLSHQMHYQDDKLQLSIIGRDGNPIAADEVMISIGRPVDNGEDLTLKAQRKSDGQFEAAAKLGSGIWSGELSAKVDGKAVWRQPFRLLVGQK